MKKRILPLALALVLCLGLFAGCQSSELRAYSDESPSLGGEGETMVKDYGPVFETFAPDTVMLTINGYDVTWQELFYWYHNDVSSIEAYFGDITDWDAPAAFDETVTYREYVTDGAIDVSKLYRVFESKYADAGIVLTDEELATIDANWQANVESFGAGEAGFLEYLDSVYMTKDIYYYFNAMSMLLYALQEEMYGAEGEKLDEADVIAKAEESGLMRAKHILLRTVDEAYSPLEDDVIAEKLATAETLLAELQTITDPDELEARLDELGLEYNEDTGTLYYPDGYTFGAGEMDPAFEAAVAEMEDYELSGIVETFYGYHIILRLPLKGSAIIEYDSSSMPYTLAYMISQEIFVSTRDSWVDECEIVYSKEYESIDLSALFAKAVMVPAPLG